MYDVLICSDKEDSYSIYQVLSSVLGIHSNDIFSDDKDSPMSRMWRKLKDAKYLVVNLSNITNITITLMSMAFTLNIPIVGLLEHNEVYVDSLSRWIDVCDTVITRDEIIDYFRDEYF